MALVAPPSRGAVKKTRQSFQTAGLISATDATSRSASHPHSRFTAELDTLTVLVRCQVPIGPVTWRSACANAARNSSLPGHAARSSVSSWSESTGW